MSEDGWRAFVAADGRDDWAVLHGGATAVFRVSSLGDAVRLADAVAKIPGIAGSGVALTAGDDRLSVRLTRDQWLLEPAHIELARAVSEVARAHGALADLTAVQEIQFAVSARPDEVDLPFWRAVLGYDPASDDNGVDPLAHSSTVWMQELDADRPLRHAMHIDVSLPRSEVEARVAAALAAGGRVVEDREAPGVWILADRAGNRVCVVGWPDGAPLPEPEAEPSA